MKADLRWSVVTTSCLIEPSSFVFACGARCGRRVRASQIL